MRFPQDYSRITSPPSRPDLAGASGIVAVRPVAPRTAPPRVMQRLAPTTLPATTRRTDTRKLAQRRTRPDRRRQRRSAPLDTRIRERRQHNRRADDHAPLPLDEQV
jgi:hypothetical protein